MIGGIIGDLAASTYLRDKDEFYIRLVGRNAMVSELSIAALLAVRTAEAAILPTLDDFRRVSNLSCLEIAPEYLCAQAEAYSPHSLGVWMMQRCIYANWGILKSVWIHSLIGSTRKRDTSRCLLPKSSYF